MNRFKVGDVVRCVDTSSMDHRCLTSGCNYTVEKLEGNSYVVLNTIDKTSWWTGRFELLNRPVAQIPKVSLTKVGVLVKCKIAGTLSRVQLDAILTIIYEGG